MKKGVLLLAILAGINGVQASAVDRSQQSIVDDEYMTSFRGTARPRSLSDCVREIIALQGRAAEKIEEINLSDNYIFDTGVKLMSKQIWGERDKFPDLKSLDLSHNMITFRALESFLPLLQRPNFKYLDIFGNAAANVNVEDFFTQLDKESLLKVIFIPEAWFASDDLETATDTIMDLTKNRPDFGKALIEEIVHAHMSYYSQKRK